MEQERRESGRGEAEVWIEWRKRRSEGGGGVGEEIKPWDKRDLLNPVFSLIKSWSE